MVLSKPRPAAAEAFTKVSCRPVELSRGDAWQLTYHFPRKETHENLPPEAAAGRCAELLEGTFEHAHLFTATADRVFKARGDGEFKVLTSRPSMSAAVKTHNRAKQYLIPEGTPCPFLFEIGVMSRTGQVLTAKYHKFRQINRFLELVDDVLPHLPEGRELQVFDFGSGKSYLTFALHHLLTEVRGRAAHIVGVDRNAEVIRDCSRIAARLGCRGLEFQVGDIVNSPPPADHVDLIVSLHACDTATDDALAQAVRWKAPVILAVPCCQHELARVIHNSDLQPLETQGILHERFAALATDALRAAALEISGYATQILEFIDLEHTPKNLLIRAVRHTGPTPHLPQRVQAYRQFKASLGLEQPYLERALGPAFEQLLVADQVNS
jgi:SAM-dependent methyltransferase